MSQDEVNNTGWRGTTEGKIIKSVSGWYSNGNGVDEYDFSALPGGMHFKNSQFSRYEDLTEKAYFWSSTNTNSSAAWYRFLDYEHDNIYRTSSFYTHGFSVRCLKD